MTQRPLMTPTDLASSYSTMSLPNPDNQWYLDSGATSHMKNNSGTLLPLFNLSTKSHILVSNGHRIPVTGYGHSTLPHPTQPLVLRDVLLAPQIIKNLISVHRFTSDNSVSIEFDPFGFSVKDLHTGSIITRCDSPGDLYPVTTAKSTPSTCLATSLTAVSPTTWHNRLGHPGAPVFSLLKSRNLIHCNKEQDSMVCTACHLGKHTRVPFHHSNSTTFYAFDIIHVDLWTSPVRSDIGHKYYMVLIDDFTHFIWTIPLVYKSQAYRSFLNFRKYVVTQFDRLVKSFQSDHSREFNNNPLKKIA